MSEGMAEDWKPISELPDDRKDGRPMLIRHGSKPWERRARFHIRAQKWLDERTGGVLLGVEAWADPA